MTMQTVATEPCTVCGKPIIRRLSIGPTCHQPECLLSYDGVTTAAFWAKVRKAAS